MAGRVRQVFVKPEENYEPVNNASPRNVEIQTVDDPF